MVAAAGIAAAAIGAAGSIGGAAISAGAQGGGGGGLRVQGGPVHNLAYSDGAFNVGIGNDDSGLARITSTRRQTPGLTAIQERFPRILGDLDSLRGQVKPGFGVLTDIARQSGTRAVGDLKETLNRRKILGSSFANDSIARVKAEFAQQEQLAKIAEMEAFSGVINQEFGIIQTELKRDLAESQFTAGLGTQLLNLLGGAASQVQSGSPVGDTLTAAGGQLFGYGLQSLANTQYTGVPSVNTYEKAAFDVNSNPATTNLF